GAAPDCATGGVLGAMCGTVGSVMATEAIKLVTGAGETLLGRLAVYDALGLAWRQLTVGRDPDREPVTALLRATDGRDPYAVYCGTAPVARDADTVTPGEHAVARADGLDPLVLDVREEWEARITPVPCPRLGPSGPFAGSGEDAVVRDVAAWAAGRPVHVLCLAGVRSACVAGVLREAGVAALSVEGGVAALRSECRAPRSPVTRSACRGPRSYSVR